MSENVIEIETLLAEAETWLKRSGMPKSRLGLLACANSRAVDRMRDRTASVKTLEATISYIRAHPAVGVKIKK